METTNRTYGTGLAPLAAPPPSDELPSILPHFHQTTYPYQPRAKTQTFTTTRDPSGRRFGLEKERSGASGSLGATGSSASPGSPSRDSGVLGTSGVLKGSWTTSSASAHMPPAAAKTMMLTRRDGRAAAAAPSLGSRESGDRAFSVSGAAGGATAVPEPVTGDTVLRVFAYSLEGVPDSAAEAARVRRFVICYYTADGSIEITEPKLENSGLWQGAALRRHRLPRWEPGAAGEGGAAASAGDADLAASLPRALADSTGGSGVAGSPARRGRVELTHSATQNPALRVTQGAGDVGRDGTPECFYSWEDLVVGNTIRAYGRGYRIYDADALTRAWMAARGLEQPAAEPVPRDAVTERLASEALRSGKSETGHHRMMYPAKQYAEARLGKFTRDPEARRRFQEHDGKVLQFACVWDNSGAEHGDVAHLVLQYFLADDEAEIRRVAARNDGLGPGSATLVKKMAIPLDYEAARVHKPSERPDVYLRPRDLRIGSTLTIFGRPIQIRACDHKTRAWYEGEEARSAAYDAAPQPPNVEEPAEAEAASAVPIPPHNGFGDEDDSLRNCMAIDVRAPRPDLSKFLAFDGTVYRLYARLDGAASGLAAERRFTLALYPADDTLQILEAGIANSGVKGGVFLKRSKYRNPFTGKHYSPADFRIGEVTPIFGHRFLITDVDPVTREGYPHLFPPAS